MGTESTSGNDTVQSAEQDLQQRLSLAAPQHTTRGFLFTSLLRVVRDLGGDETVVKRCLAASGEKAFVEFFNYPTRSLLLLLGAAAGALSGKLGGYEEVLRQIGFKAGSSYMETPVGRTALQQAGGTPQQFMIALQTLYWVLTTYGKPALTWPGPNQGVLTVEVTFMPLAYHVGGAQAIAKKLGVKNVNVTARKTGDLSIALEVTW
ncbi:MAG TPA: TIGR02265 family protein [Archangium sp.]|nr:TIGR02265 family protein [Archangium sp.]